MEIKVVEIDKPEDVNFILGQSHFIKTVEDLYEALVSAVPGIKFGLAFCEASGPHLVRFAGNDDELTGLAKQNALSIGAGHSFIIFIRNAYPMNLLPRIKEVPEVCNIFCATANPTQVIIVETLQGGSTPSRGIIGVIDGASPLGIEGQKDIEARKQFLRDIGYKIK
ncbi:MAG: adenosine-specific kinase [Candidatus Stahlbacteria bacterium]|nr:adenosine-specific kinase [Candidatus Stahlbacteria bacterium]